jgi:hypothetical protein
MGGFGATIFSEQEHMTGMRNPLTQLLKPTAMEQAMTRRALQSHFRGELAVCGLILLLVVAAWMVIFFMPGVRLW